VCEQRRQGPSVHAAAIIICSSSSGCSCAATPAAAPRPAAVQQRALCAARAGAQWTLQWVQRWPGGLHRWWRQGCGGQRVVAWGVREHLTRPCQQGR
jgi:hypothetical protein